jgi:HEAT repeat protein
MFRNKGEDDINRAMAANALGLIGSKSVQILTECLKDTEVFVRRQAVTALTRMAPNQTAAIPALIKALDDVDEAVRAEAVEGLGPEFFGREARSQLRAALHSPSPFVRVGAATVLVETDASSTSPTQVLVSLLKHRHGEVRLAAAAAFRHAGPEAKQAVPALTHALQDPDSRVRSYAAEGLARIGPDAKPAFSALAKALADEDEFVRGYAAKALGKIGSADKGALEGLIKAIRDESDDVSVMAIRALGDIGPQASGAVDALLNAEKSNDARISREAKSALKKIRRRR